MPKQSTVRLQFVFAALSPWVLAACSSSSPGKAAPGTGSPGIDGSAGQGDGSVTAPDDAASQGGGPDATTSAHDGGSSRDGGALPGDGGTAASDGGEGGAATIDGGGDGGIRDVGSCCVVQTTPGCSNANLEVCVCQMVPTCCTAAWTQECVFLVQQKYCQPGVRTCVCGTDVDAGQWDQTTCCSTDWTSTCDTVATTKCGAVQGCF